MACVFGIAGKIRSGKTTVAKLLSSERNCQVVSFGDYVRAYVITHGFKATRENLQSFGQSFIDNDIVAFCDEVIHSSGWQGEGDLVIDGIRHIVALEAIKKIVSPMPTYLIYVESNDGIRKRRLGLNDLKILDSHPTEAGVPALCEQSDLIIPSNASITEVSFKLKSWLNATITS